MTTLESLTSLLRQERGVLDRQRAEFKLAAETGKNAEAEIAKCVEKEDLLAKASILLNKFAQSEQERLLGKIESIVSFGLQQVFEEPLQLKLTIVERSNTTGIQMSIVDDQGLETDILSARGGGVAATTGFLLRAVILMLDPTRRRMLFLDETFAQLSEEYEPRLADFLHQLVKSTGMDILLVTHSGAYGDSADRVYRVQQEDGRSTVRALMHRTQPSM